MASSSVAALNFAARMPKFETFLSLVRWHGTEKCERGAKHNSVGQDGPQQASEEPEESKGEPCAHLGGLTKASELMVVVSIFFRDTLRGVYPT